MYEIITVVIILVCLMLGFIVLIQNPKGGGLSATFGQAGNQLLGAQRSTNMVERWTWGLAIALLVFSLSTSAFIGTGTAAPDQQIGNPFGPQADPTRATTTQPVQELAPTMTAPPVENTDDN